MEDDSKVGSPAVELVRTLIQLEQGGVPLDDFGNALLELSMVDQYTHIDLVKEFARADSTPFGLHGANHTIRVVFWVLYLVEISNRLGYGIKEEDALAAMYAALIHDLSRKDDFPGGQHGRDAAQEYRDLLKAHLPEQLLDRCLKAVEWHGYADEPSTVDVVLMLLKDADALDRARLAAPGRFLGCDPSRLRLPVLRENTLVLEACLTISMLLAVLLTLYEVRPPIFRNVTRDFINIFQAEMEDQDVSTRQAAHLITDRFYPA